MAFHLGALGAFFLRVLEYADAVELGLFEEGEEFGEVFFGLAGEADDEGGADDEIRDACTHAGDQVADIGAIGLTLHCAEHLVGDVLERDVDVADHVFGLANRLNELVAPVSRVRVEQADPEVAFDLVKLAEKRGEGFALGGVDLAARVWAGLGPAIHAEIGRVLGDQIDLLHAFGNELTSFLDDGFDRAAAMASANTRDDAESAGVVAAFGDLDVGRMARRQTEARGVKVRDEGGRLGEELGHAGFAAHDFMDDRNDVRDLVQADKRVDLRQLDAAFSTFDDG